MTSGLTDPQYKQNMKLMTVVSIFSVLMNGMIDY